MFSDSASLVLFAIKTATKLGEQVRLAYVDSTRRREIVLPLPNFFRGTNEADAAQFFSTPNTGGQFVSPAAAGDEALPPEPRLKLLLQQFNAGALSATEKRELIDFHVKYKNVLESRNGGGSHVAAGELYALLTVQQWRRGTDPTPSTLHRVAGSLVEIGIDYALASPDLVDRNSRRGKLALGFLTALDEIDFAETEISEIPARLFVATLETASEHTELLTGDPKAQELLRVTTKGLSTDVAKRLEAIDKDAALDAVAKRAARRDVQDWAELLFRGTLATGGRLALSDPAKYLGVTAPGSAALITAVSNSVLEFTVADGRQFSDLLSRPGLETILEAALESVAAHPEIVVKSDNRAVSAFLAGLAKDLAGSPGVLRPNVLPEIARMTLQRTGQNLSLYWPDLKNRPEYNLLGAAAKTVLDVLTATPPDGQPWRPTFRREDLLQVTEVVLDELVANPGWLIDRTGKLTPVLREVLTAVHGALREHGDPRLSAATGTRLMRTALTAVVSRTEFASQLDGKGPIVAEVVRVVLAAAFDPAQAAAVTWRMVSADAIAGLLEETLRTMARHRIDAPAFNQLAATLKGEMAQLATGGGFDLARFTKALDKALS